MTTDNQHTIIIAEAGVNHNGDMSTALSMIEQAAAAGVDYVKFQTFKAENLVSATAEKAEYQKANCGSDESQYAMLKKLELSAADFGKLRDACRRAGVGFMSSPFDLESLEVLKAIGQDYWKVASGEITNLPLLKAIGSLGGKVILSTGMSTIDEVSAAVELLVNAGTIRENIILLHCNTQYPTPMNDVNLRAMSTLRSVECGGVGYSDHTCGIEVSIAAVAMGAKVIEKHFTLDKNMPGPDHKASADVTELRAMVAAVRNVEKALGTPEKRVTPSEMANRGVARKSIVASRPIKAGEILGPENMTTKRPGDGLSPMLWYKVCGTQALMDYEKDEQIVVSARIY